VCRCWLLVSSFSEGLLISSNYMSFCAWEEFNGSEVLAAGRYDWDISRLELRFRDGKTYEYHDVPASVWQAFCRAPSKGAFFNSRISSNYPSRPVGQGATRQEATRLHASSTQSGYAALGSSLNNPFHTSSIPFAYKLLDGLHFKTSRGIFKVQHRRVGSTAAGGLPEPVDHYQLYVTGDGASEFGHEPRDFFVYSYSGNPHSEDALPGGLIYVKEKGAPPLPVQSAGDSAQSYYDLAMKLMAGKPSDPQVQAQIGILLRKAADMNHADAQEALFMIYSTRKDRANDAMLWWHRAQRTRQGLPNSPATDYKPGVMQGGCASLLVIGLLVAGAAAAFI